MLRPEGLYALHRQGLLRSSFRGFGSLHAHVEYNYAGKQPLPAAGLTPARNKALWAATRNHERAKKEKRPRNVTTLSGQFLRVLLVISFFRVFVIRFCLGHGPSGREIF